MEEEEEEEEKIATYYCWDARYTLHVTRYTLHVTHTHIQKEKKTTHQTTSHPDPITPSPSVPHLVVSRMLAH